MAKFAIDIKNTKQMAAIAGAIGLGMVYLYLNFLLLPQIRGTAKIYDKAKKISADLAVSEREASEVAGLKAQVARYHDKIETYEKMLPVEQEIPRLLGNLSTMAKNANVKIVGITPLQSKQEGAAEIYQEIPILINARSGYHELGKFLSDLENSDRFMKVADINIKENKTTPKKHDVELMVLTYVLLENR